MHPPGVASAAWVLASAPSKVPFYVAAGLLAGWAVVLAALGLSHADFPGSTGRARVVMLTSVVLVAATMTAAVATAGKESAEAPARATPSTGAASTVQLAADPTGQLAYDKKSLTATAGRITIDFTNRSPVPHNVTIAKGTKVVVGTKTINGTTTKVAGTLTAGKYVFYCSVDAHRQAGMQGTLIVR
jgi:plastocyanin